MKILVDYLFWHYCQAPKKILKIWLNYLIFFYHYFSVDLLSSTLFYPWKRQYLAKTSTGFSFEEWLTRFTFNLLSRIIGATVRLLTIISWGLVEDLIFLAGLLFIPLWILTPFLSFPIYWTTLKKNIIKKKQEAYEQFLSKRALDEKDIPAVSQWFERVWKKRQKESQFWALENLLKTPGIADTWAYGFTPSLDKYTKDLTQPKPYSHHLVGREKEVERIEQILSRAAQNNVLIIGDPGVGKETIILGFAKKVKEGTVLPILKRKRVLELNMTALLAEVNQDQALSLALKEASSAGNIILVIFDFDKYVSTGPERQDLTTIFLPYLAGAQIQVIGITTPFAFQKYIFKNPQIAKVFEKVEVEAPTKEEALIILEEILPRFEQRTGTCFTYKALQRIVEGSDDLITHIPFPEKAIDLLDETSLLVQRKGEKIVLPAHVDMLLTQKTKVPVGELTAQEKEKLTNLDKILHQRVIDQEEAVSSLTAAMRRARLGISQKGRPIGSFLFLGPTGVGKTQTAKTLAWAWFGKEDKMIRIDFSEFQTKEDLSRLIGDFKGGEPGILPSSIREKPFSVLLLDEIEKAHPKILNLFLQVLDEGYFTDAFGKKVSCRNLIIIATSNAGAQFIKEKVKEQNAYHSEPAPGGEESVLTTELINYIQKKHIFSPEFLNRFDGLIVFKPLTQKNLEEIARLLLEELNERLSKKKVKIKITPDLTARVAELGFHPALGARPMRRVIQDKIESQIAKDILEGKIKEGQLIEIQL